MKVSQVLARIEAIKSLAGDCEAAHSEEDKLHVDVLREIAKGGMFAEELAKAALRTLDIEFERWYA